MVSIAVALVIAAQAAASPKLPAIPFLDGKSVASVSSCGPNHDEKVITVCGTRGNSYRIDGAVLAGERARDTVPDRLQNLDPDQAEPCVGPNCGGDFVPLVAIAIKLATAAVDAANGNDWRDDFRTHPDEYSAYLRAKERQGSKATFSLSASAASH